MRKASSYGFLPFVGPGIGVGAQLGKRVAVGFKRVDVAPSAGAPGSLFGLTLKVTH